MSSPLSSPLLPSQSGQSPEFLEAVKRLATAHEALKSADLARLKVMSIPPNRKGGGAARKKKAQADYKAALGVYNNCQMQVASLTGSNNQTMPVAKDSNADVGASSNAGANLPEDMEVDAPEDSANADPML
ncbi:hypothetical protein H0H92_006835, partial [Tricholoma furcatifolium]